MSLCMLTNMLEKYHTFFILICVYHGINQKEILILDKTTNRRAWSGLSSFKKTQLTTLIVETVQPA